MSSTTDLTTGSLPKKILIFSLPLMFSNILQVLFNMADVAVVGRFAGAYALGAVGSTSILVMLFTGFLIGMGNGVNVLTARFYGARKERDVKETVHTSLIICLITGVIILVVGIAFARGLLELLNTKDELIDGATLYLRIYFVGMPAMAIYNFGSGVLSAVGDTKKPLYYLLTAGIINVVLNLFFVIVCELDVAGVSLATVISQYISATLILHALFKSKEMYGLSLAGFGGVHHGINCNTFSKEKAISLLVLGVPAGVQNAIFAVANLFIQASVNSFDATMVSGNAAAANSDGLVYEVMAAFYVACASFIGQNYGAGKKDRILKSYFVCLAYSFGVGAILGGGLLIWGRQFLGLFTTETAVIESGMLRLQIMAFSYAVSAFMDCTIAAARGLGKSLVPTIIVVMGSCVFRIVWIYTIFATYRTITSLYLLYIFSWSITAIAAIVYFAWCYRKVGGK
ncbi:MAG: MATE family efflux transporter [Lachnospira sp.]|nr:MATE family efflux transporter [Lachnospira sp.]